jgi:hypothetical protein
MANNFASNFTRKVMMKVLERFEANRVMSKNVDTQLFNGQFNPNTGDTIDVKRPTDYQSVRTSGGDISSSKRDIITGKASATVQNYITVAVDYDEADEAIKMGTDINRFWDDIANRIVIDLETDFASFMMKNTGLLSGTLGQGVDAWSEVANAGALMQSSGVPMNKRWCYALNPYSQVALADQQRALGVNPEAGTANERATVMENFAGFNVKTATTLQTYTTQAGADRAGTISSNPDVTYVTHKDTMQQAFAVTGFQANLSIKAGEQVQVTGRNRLNMSTRDPIIDASGSQVLYTGTVVSDVTLNGSGAGTITLTGPAIYEATGGYNTVDSAPVAGDVVTLLGSASTIYQPNLFWHPDAFTIASVPIKKLHSTDTVGTTRDGLQLRTSMYADGDANKQTVRIDLRPAYGVMNPFFAGQGFGTA